MKLKILLDTKGASVLSLKLEMRELVNLPAGVCADNVWKIRFKLNHDKLAERGDECVM